MIQRGVERRKHAGNIVFGPDGPAESVLTIGDLAEVRANYLATGTPARWSGDQHRFLAPSWILRDDPPEARFDPRNAAVEIYGAPVRRYQPKLTVFRGGKSR